MAERRIYHHTLILSDEQFWLEGWRRDLFQQVRRAVLEAVRDEGAVIRRRPRWKIERHEITGEIKVTLRAVGTRWR